MYHVVIIEDHPDTGNLLWKFLDAELQRLVTQPGLYAGVEESPRNPKSGARFEDAMNEPGQGQLVHLRHAIDKLEELRMDPENNVQDAFPTVHLFPQDKLAELSAAATYFQPSYGHRAEDESPECLALRRVVDKYRLPDILVVDLVMDENEGALLEGSGGLDIVDDAQPELLRDPRDLLRKTTGFKLLRAYASRVPVIVTSYLSNPLIAQHCLVNGAFAYVRKPVRGESDNAFDFRNASEVWRVVDKSAKLNDSPLDVVVTHYLTETASEILKAMSARLLPRLVPYTND